ncbi:MAG: NAD-dependent epimerase/dehydratase family protein [Candidatus Marinimicrobia bacterium]|nr:NAD-dependent epimerase/dehydratase family protein [Candidatus Neomarinimicrobiota bacterium]MCF7850935.1 NAD-dependent epimerase/dehydratase family protein [Candidatus Neomarinimicrobiota bacterium]
MQGKKILVLGGTGFISGRLVALLNSAGATVSTLTRGNVSSDVPEIQQIKGDRRNIALLQGLANQNSFDVVIDMIAYGPEDSLDAITAFKGKVGQFIHCSSISVYMISDKPTCPITEDQWQLPEMEYDPRNPFGMDYGIQKRKCEEVLWDAHHLTNFPVTCLRPTYVGGPADPACRDYFWIERIRDGGPLLVPGEGAFQFQSVYVEDVAQAFLRSIENAEAVGQAFNVVGDEHLTLNEYLKLLMKKVGQIVPLIHMDQKDFDESELSQHTAGDVFPFNTRRHAIFGNEKIRTEIGFNATPLEVWLEHLIEWYSEKYDEHSTGYERRQQEIQLAAMLGPAGDRL